MNMVRSALWQEKGGVPDKLMAINGPLADMVLVTRPSPKGHIARMFLKAALLHYRRPVMVLSPNQTRAPGRRIAIAWNQSAEVMRSISACMPMLQQAEAVTILMAGSENRLGPKAPQLQNYLKGLWAKSDGV